MNSKTNAFQTHFVWIFLISFLVVVSVGHALRKLGYLEEPAHKPRTNTVIRANMNAFRDTNAPAAQ